MPACHRYEETCHRYEENVSQVRANVSQVRGKRVTGTIPFAGGVGDRREGGSAAWPADGMCYRHLKMTGWSMLGISWELAPILFEDRSQSLEEDGIPSNR